MLSTVGSFAQKPTRRASQAPSKQNTDFLDRRILLVLSRLMAQARPTGPMPSEPWYDPEEEAEVKLIGDAFDTYMQAHNYRKSQKNISCITAAFNEYLTATKLHENLTLHHITKESGRTWINYMQTPKQFPARAVPKAVTIDAKIKQVRHFLQYCVSQDWIESNPFANLALPSRVVTASRQHKEAFTDPELSLIFSTLTAFLKPIPRWQGNPARVEFYYAVLLLAFTGARANEIIQLRAEDVKQIEGVWCVDLCEGPGKQFKNRPSLRVVPIHSQLLPVFLPWFQSQSGLLSLETTPKLFPSLTSSLASRWFSKEILFPAGIKRPALSLHSLRHTLTHKLIHARTYAPLQNRLLGHALGKTVELTSYTRGLEFSVKELSAAIESCTFPSVPS